MTKTDRTNIHAHVLIADGFLNLPSDNDLIPLSTYISSKGNQSKFISYDLKWYYKQCFYYQNRFWRDDLVEVIASQIGEKFADIPEVSVLKQYPAVRFNGSGVFSENFLADDEQFITFNRLISAYNYEIRFNKGIQTFDEIVEAYRKLCGIDAVDYLLVQAFIDYLVGNEDRHTDNFGVIASKHGYRLPPLFDFGLGMFEHDMLYDDYIFKEKAEHMQFKTFGKSQFALVQDLAVKYPKIFNRLINWQLHPSEFNFPSVHAETYLRYACGKVGIEVCND